MGVDSALVTNIEATRRFIDEVQRKFSFVNIGDTKPDGTVELARRWGEVYVVLLDRTDRPYWRSQANDDQAFVAALDPSPPLPADRRLSPTDRLRIWRLTVDGG